jgi:hypothetical protein
METPVILAFAAMAALPVSIALLLVWIACARD